MISAREAFDLSMESFEKKYADKVVKAKERVSKRIKVACKDARTSIQCQLHKNVRVSEILKRGLQSNQYHVTEVPNSNDVIINWAMFY